MEELELASILLTSGFGLLGTVIGAGITWWVTKRATKTQTTFDLYSEFSSEPLLTSRHRAQNTPSLFDGDKSRTLDQMFGELQAEERAHIWNIIHFYEKLYLLIKHRRCNTEYVPDLFGEVFYWWDLHCFQAKLAPLQDREASIRLTKLRGWFEKNAERGEIARWVERTQRTAKKLPPDRVEIAVDVKG